MNRLPNIRLGLVIAVLTVLLSACATGGADSEWTTLVQGSNGLENFNQIGEAKWTATDGAIATSNGGNDASYLVTKNRYQDFMLRVEFWASDDANSGVFIRCQDPANIQDTNCYEANIFDQRPDPTYGTGAIVQIAKAPVPMPKAGGKWNTYEISAKGSRLVLVLNGIKTVDIEDTKLANGYIALQWGRGTIKFRKIEIRPL
jgi:Domain of Unknown Function (DUF1080)